jgi:hypothetical protein
MSLQNFTLSAIAHQRVNFITQNGRVQLIFANMSVVGAKHSGSKYQITANNLYTGMLRPLQN